MRVQVVLRHTIRCAKAVVPEAKTLWKRRGPGTGGSDATSRGTPSSAAATSAAPSPRCSSHTTWPSAKASVCSEIPMSDSGTAAGTEYERACAVGTTDEQQGDCERGAHAILVP